MICMFLGTESSYSDAKLSEAWPNSRGKSPLLSDLTMKHRGASLFQTSAVYLTQQQVPIPQGGSGAVSEAKPRVTHRVKMESIH